MGIKESAIKSCEARIKHLQNVPPHYHGKRQRMREIELEKVKIAALTPPNEWVRVDEWLPDFDTEQMSLTASVIISLQGITWCILQTEKGFSFQVKVARA